MLVHTPKYTDLSFFITKNPFTGDINLVKDILSIKYCLKNLILTQFNERPFNTSLGTGIYGAMFNVDMTNIASEISQSIYRNETRVEDIKTSAKTDGKTINIEVSFKIISTEEVNTLSLTI